MPVGLTKEGLSITSFRKTEPWSTESRRSSCVHSTMKKLQKTLKFPTPT